jgi:CheY-like chemotaxis protein
LIDLVDSSGRQMAAARRQDRPLDAQALVAQLGGEVAATLSSALERVAELAATGRIDKSGLRLLREEIDHARRAGIMGQQLVRLGSGQMQLAPERLDLTSMLREALMQRGREIEARGIQVRQTFAAAEVRSDATLLFSLLQTVLDWSFEHAVSRIDIGLEVKNWPEQAHLVSTFAHRPADEAHAVEAAFAGAEEAALNTMSWRLLQQTATALGLPLERRDTPGRTEMTLQFPETLAPSLGGFQLSSDDQPATPVRNEFPLAGRHVIVLAARREVRNTVRESLRQMGMVVDFVTSVQQAQELVREAMPHALVYEASLAGDAFERLRTELMAEAPKLAFICIAEQGRAFEVLNVGGRQVASVGRDAVVESLPAALMFELTRSA